MEIMIKFLTLSDKWKWGGDEWQKVYYRLVNTKYLVWNRQYLGISCFADLVTYITFNTRNGEKKHHKEAITTFRYMNLFL